MWILLGIMTIIATCTNLYLYNVGKDNKLAMAIGLSFTALTVCAEYSLVSQWVKEQDWTALADVVPTMETVLWIFTIASILLNMIPVFLEARSEK